MAFHYLDKYARDDATVKFVFDHLRNIGLVGFVLAASAWKEQHIGVGWVAVWDHVVVAVLGFCGFGLLWINHENLMNKLRNKPASKWVKYLIVIIYTIIFTELLKYLQHGKTA